MIGTTVIMSFKFLKDHSEHFEGSPPLLNKTYESVRFLTSMEGLIEAPRFDTIDFKHNRNHVKHRL